MYGRFTTVLLLTLSTAGVVLGVLLQPLCAIPPGRAWALPPQEGRQVLTATQKVSVGITHTPPSSPLLATPVSTATATAPPPMPEAALTPTPALEQQVIALLSARWPLIAAGCGGFILVAAILLLRITRLKKPRPRPVEPSPPAGPYLEGSTISGEQRRFALKPEGFTIGRELGNDLVITAEFPGWETASRRHARVYCQAGRWIVEDLNSMNGVYVNGKRTGRNLLYSGWELRIGGVAFTFHAGTGEVEV